MGGSGGSFKITPAEAHSFKEQMRERIAQQRSDADINAYLRRELLAANDRDTDKVNERIEEIEKALSDRVQNVGELRFGGSIAKHTYVEGLSDVDLLVPLSDEHLVDHTPDELRREFAKILEGKLSAADVAEIDIGRLAVTVTYRDGTEIQLLPAVNVGDTISISAQDGKRWQHGIKPNEFTDKLTETNKTQGGLVVPVIKLAKEIIATQIPDERQPSGYHVEALAVSTFADYTGPKTPKAMVTHLFKTASGHVVHPAEDVTGQSVAVDHLLGDAGSPHRLALSNELTGIANKMERSQSVDDWKKLFGL